MGGMFIDATLIIENLAWSPSNQVAKVWTFKPGITYLLLRHQSQQTSRCIITQDASESYTHGACLLQNKPCHQIPASTENIMKPRLR